MFFRKKEEVAETPTEKPVEDTTLTTLRQKLEDARLPEHAQIAADKELTRLEKTDPAMAEYTVGINYLEIMASLPWSVSSKGNLDLARARSILENSHCGLEQVKQRILEFLAARTLQSTVTRSVLIVDDEDIARENMCHVLKKDGYSCFGCGNGKEALAILEKEEVDLIVSDLKMEQMDGLELLEEVKVRFPEIPVIMVTGFASVSSAVEAMKKGAAYYLGKPVNLNELRKTVEQALETKLVSDGGRGTILCFAGPPGTGKTSVGKAIAEAMEVEFIRVSLAGLKDEAELRGHRRTYVGAMSGRILTELKRAGTNNPVFMLDEIDKIGQDFRGDPASVMLEVLDPEQNTTFMDHYLDVPFNLSRIMFVATANDLSTLPGPLLDRMEIVEFTGYTEKEKQTIAQQFIIPRQLKATGLAKADISFTPEAVSRVINEYTRESGLRNLEREFGNMCRKLALLCLDKGEDQKEFSTEVDRDMVPRLLGPRRVMRGGAEKEHKVGIATGLVWSETGGEVIRVESAAMKGGGQLMLTGSLGEVLQESAHAALSLIRSRAEHYGIDEHFFQEKDIHIHFPAAAISKDGPSAGITIFSALLSLTTGRKARADVAMTGEMTLSGRILPISGVREKLLAAQREGVSRVLLPEANREEVELLPEDVRMGVEVVFVKESEELVPLVLLEP